MSEQSSGLLPPDLDRLRALQTYLRLQLAEVDARIQQLEQAARPAARQRPGPSPADRELRWWRFVPLRGGHGGGTLHRGDCQTAGGALLSLAEARLMLDEQGVRPCRSCRPELRLGQTARAA